MSVRTSETTAGLMEALATAQGNFGAAIKGNVNPAFRSKYADLSAVIDATLEHLNKAGVVVMQHPSLDYKGEGESREAFVTVTTRLQLKGEWLESDIAIPAVQRDRFDAQSVGSAITYGCRYALQSILVVPREDDDANAATGRGTHEAAKAVGEAKVAELKKKTAQQGSNGHAEPSQLCVYPLQGGDAFEVTGEPEVMNLYKDVLLANGKKTGAVTVLMTGEQLDSFRFEFCEKRGGILTPLKAAKA